MLRIRQDQLKIFEKLSRELFIAKTSGLVRSQHPELAADLPDDKLHPIISQTLDLAQNYGLVVEADVYEFSVLRLLFGADWLNRPEYRWAQTILADKSQSPDVRLFQVREHLQLQAEKSAAHA